MSRVSTIQLRAICGFLEGAYDSVAHDVHEPDCGRGALPTVVLRGLMSLVGADAAESFQLRRGDFEDAPHTSTRDTDEPLVIGAFRGRGGVNPISAFAWSPADGPQRLSALVSRRRLQSLPMYRLALEPHGIRDQLKVWLWSSGDAAACVNLDRMGGLFDDRDRAVLAVLQQHLAAMRESLMTASDNQENRRIEALTVREAQVLTWASRGRRNREIAELLFISPATVRKHLENAYAKLGVGNRMQAAAALRGADGKPGAHG